jgi:hypothetical protein
MDEMDDARAEMEVRDGCEIDEMRRWTGGINSESPIPKAKQDVYGWMGIARKMEGKRAGMSDIGRRVQGAPAQGKRGGSGSGGGVCIARTTYAVQMQLPPAATPLRLHPQ